MAGVKRAVRRILAGLATWAVLAGSALAQNGPLVPQPEPPAVAAPPYCCPPLSPPDCRQCGNIPQPDLAIPPDCWPMRCDNCKPCDPLQTGCPDRADFFLLPPRPAWYLIADGGALCRRANHAVDFAALGLLPTGGVGLANIVLSTDDFPTDFRAAGRFVVGHTFNDCLQIEGGYLGISQSQNNSAVRDSTPNDQGGTGNLFSPFGSFGATPVDNLDYNNFTQISYTSSLQSLEVNIRRHLPLVPEKLTASILFGVRYFGLPEDFQYFTQSGLVFNPPSPPVPGTVTNSIHITTDNQMIGPQIGAMFEFYAENRWWVNFEMKAAVLNNRATLATTYENIINGVSVVNATSVRDDHTAFAADLNLTFVYRWSPHFTTRLGYQALWLDEIAVAPDNFNTNIDIVRLGPAQLNHSSGTIYHGPFAGVEFGW
jgi:hypothetical protein